MNETTSSTGVTAPVTETKTRKPRSIINQAQARELTKAETVAQAAQHATRATALAERDIDAAYVTAMFTEISNARDKAAEVVINATAQREATAAQTAAEKRLVALLQEVQKAAKQKYARNNRLALQAYFVGKKLNGSQPNLAQSSQTILGKLATDTLPGITAAKVVVLEAARTNWVNATEAQNDAESAALGARTALKTLLKSVSDRRVAVQLAADAEWPHSESENSGVRREFALPAKQPAKI
ncbi:MAG: hypothetical protein QM813_07310 [Verrucomicrobiota bacterium]